MIESYSSKKCKIKLGYWEKNEGVFLAIEGSQFKTISMVQHKIDTMFVEQCQVYIKNRM